MGYDLTEIRIPLRLDRHNGPAQEQDDEAAEDLRKDIERLIARDKGYQRIAILGVEGP